MGLDDVYKIHYYSQVCNDTGEEASILDSQLFRMEPSNLYQDV